MLTINRLSKPSSELLELISELDKELAVRDGDDHAFYNQYNGLGDIHHFVIAYKDELALACGAFKEYDSEQVEIKRMFTSLEVRGKGLAIEVLNELEAWAKEIGYKNCILETGIKQPEAIRLYEKQGYSRIENFGQYKGVEASYCFMKRIDP